MPKNSKPAKTLQTPEDRMQKHLRKQEKHDLFFDTFERVSYFFLALVLVTSVLRISFMRDSAPGAGTTGTSQVIGTLTPTEPATLPQNAVVPETTTLAANPTKEPSKPENSMPATTSEIAAYLKTAMDKVKSKAASATLLAENNTNYNNVIEVGNSAILNRIAQSLMNRFLTPGEPNTTFTGADIQANFPPEGMACNLTAADLETASCREEGDFYLISAVLKKDVNPKAGYGSGSVCSIITEDQILAATEGIINISNIRCEYDGVTVTAKIEKATGNLTALHTTLPMYLNLTALRIDCRLGLQFEEEWAVTW